jgi:hypothetical protein
MADLYTLGSALDYDVAEPDKVRDGVRRSVEHMVTNVSALVSEAQDNVADWFLIYHACTSSGDPKSELGDYVDEYDQKIAQQNRLKRAIAARRYDQAPYLTVALDLGEPVSPITRGFEHLGLLRPDPRQGPIPGAAPE